jgi:hypothetical protein
MCSPLAREELNCNNALAEAGFQFRSWLTEGFHRLGEIGVNLKEGSVPNHVENLANFW